VQETSVVTDKDGGFGIAVEEFKGIWEMYLSATKEGKKLDCRIRLDRASRPVTHAYAKADTYLPEHTVVYDSLVSLETDPMLQALPDSVFLLDNVDVHGRKKYVDYLTFKAYDVEEDTEFHLDQGKWTTKIGDYLKEKGYNADITYYDGVVPECATREDYITWALDQCPINNRRVLWYLHDEDKEWHKSAFTPGFDLDMEDVKSIIVYDSPHEYTSIPIVREVLTTKQLLELEKTKTSDVGVLLPGLYVIDIAMYPKGERKTKTKGQRQTIYRGYSEVPEFYAPEYPDGPIKGDVDYRRTLYWNPSLTTDSSGEATVTFYNNGYSKQFVISAEGVTSQGVIMQQRH
jgi:hypothetical protein